MRPGRWASSAMFALLYLQVFLLCIVRPSTAQSSPHWYATKVEPELVQPPTPALPTCVYIRQDPTANSSDSVVQSKPADDDYSLTWDRAVGEGKIIVKLLDTDDLPECGAPKSNFTKWEALADNGWSKRYQGAPKDGPNDGTDWRHAAENLNFSSDDRKNIQYDLEQLGNVSLDGTNYQSSDGFYDNVMNTGGGIFALHGLSPRARGTSQVPPLDGSQGHELVPLQTWADVAFLEWADACKGDDQCIKGLRMVTKCHSDSNATMQIGNQALGDPEKWDVWPGQSFDKDSEQFAALMSTPVGRGVAWLLLTHREQLGWKHVKSVDLWAGSKNRSESNYFTFHLEDHADSNTLHMKSTRSPLPVDLSNDLGVKQVARDSQGNESSIIYDNGSGDVNYGLAYLSDHNYTYDEAQKIGGYLANLTQSSTEQPCIQQSQWNFSDLALNGWSSSTTELNTTGAIDTFEKVISDAKLSINDENTEHTVWRHDTATQFNGTTYPATHASYDALYSRHAIFLLGASSPASSSSGTQVLMPPLKASSDVLWLQWVDWVNAKKTAVEDLRFVGVYRLTNLDTARVVEQVFDNHEPPAYPGKSFAADSRELYALLASPHGQGVVWLLGQHQSELGVRSVKSVQIWKDQQPCLLFEVASVDANDTQDALSEDTVTQPRDLRKSLLVRATSWKDTVAKGKGFLQMLKCGSGTPSEFDKYEDLEHWGWKVDYDMHPNSDFESSYLRSVEYLEASYSEEETFQVIYKHDVAVTVDGEEYPPTGADYSNIYAPEFIICQNNWGPRVSGPDQIPPVEESFPKLERQSDVMFLEYQRKMNYLNKPMTGLKGILRDHVVNKETQAIVARALDMRSWIIGSKPSWPGHDFDINSDEAAAIIASPNGRAAVWLLATHKEQLGHKTISKVRVFSQGTAMYILFGFEDVGNDSDDDEDGGVPLDSGHSTATVSAAAIAPRLAQLQSKTVVEESGDGQQMSIAVPNKIAVVEQSAASGVAGRGIGMTPQKYQVLLEKGRKLVSAFKSGEDCFAQSEFTEYEDLADWGWEVTQDDRRGPMRTTTSSTVFNFLGASWDANVNRWVHDKHGKTTQRDGKTYLSTGARYSNHFNPLVIIAKSNYGPAYNVPKQRPPVTGGLNDPYPVLAQLSDIFFLEFQRVMEEQNQPMNTLKGVWRDYVVNQDTKDLAIWITDADGMLHNIPRWPGEDFAADSDGFAALLACPNGVGVAYLLLQHQKQLGQKTITSVKVWYDMGLHILFLIGDKEGKRTTPPSRRRTLDSPNTDLSLYSDSTGVDLQPRVLDDATFANLTETGKAFVLALQSTDTCITQSEWTTEDSLNTWGWNRARQTNVDPTSSLNATKIVYDFVGASIGTDANHRATDTHSDKEVVDGNIYYQTGAKFDSLYNSALISVLSIRGVEYQGKTQDPPVTGDPNPYPKLKLWSDVTFLEYQQFMKDSGQAVDGLKAVWHSAIINSETLDLASRLCKVDDWTNIPVWPGKDFEPGTDEFAAMIGSDNGKGVVYLLLQHREQLGSRSITNARIWKDNTLQILYTIDDTCAGNASLTPTTPSLIRRADEPDSQKLNDARDAGRFLLMAQDADTKTLDECLSIKQSTFTETTQMDEFGWTRLANRAELIDEENNNAIFNCWHELNLDVSENKNRLVEYQHLDQSTGSDGTVYYPSGAYYQNMFNEEGIVALDNASPWKTGPKKNPPVDGRTRPFPPLRQWSDVVFPIYKDICEDDPVRMKKLKAVLQQTVSNAISRDALHEYMAKNGDLVENKPKVWPGTDYNLDDDGFNVALGIPNGKGIAYLLATHREDLGWKEVYKIRIFSVSWASRYNILYYIRHHQDSATRRDRPTAPLKIGGNGIAPGEVIPHENHLAGREKAVESVVPTGEAATKFHWKRADDEAAYYSNLRRGVLLRCKIHTDAASEPQSQWVNYKSLWYYGWEDEELDEDENFGDRMGEILKALDCPADLSANQQRFLAHRFDSDDHGQDYPATNAVYHNRFNVECGAIIAELNNGPAAAVRDQPDFPLIPLRQYSDVIFLEWQEMARDNVKNLKYVIRSSIINQETKAVLRYIFAKRRVQLGPWPGLHIETSHEDAWAIMGTPNGRGVAWMLIQHKVQLGLKYISGVTVWQDHDHWSFCIFIKDMEDGASDADLPLDLEELQSDAGESEELFANQARAAPLFDTATGITTEYPRIRAGGRLTKALAKRLGDSMKNLWTAMWLA